MEVCEAVKAYDPAVDPQKKTFALAVQYHMLISLREM